MTITLAFGLVSSNAFATVGGVTAGYVVWPANASYYNMDQRIRIDVAPLVTANQGWFWASQFFCRQNGWLHGFSTTA